MLSRPPAAPGVPPAPEPKRHRELLIRIIAVAALVAAILFFLFSECAMKPPQPSIDVRVPDPAGEDFSLHAAATGLFPGGTRPLRLRVINRNAVPVEVTRLTVLVHSDPALPGCQARAYVRTSGLDRRLRIPAEGIRHTTLTITMLPGAPDQCSGATFPLRLTARAVRA
jgi:hypothetical protein